jgi:hypothetical protein
MRFVFLSSLAMIQNNVKSSKEQSQQITHKQTCRPFESLRWKIAHFQPNSQTIPPPAIIVPIIIAPAITKPKTSFPPLNMDTAAPVNTGVALLVVVGVEDDVNVEVTALALPLEVAYESEVPIVPLQEQQVEVAVTVIKDTLSEDAEAEVEADVTT